MHSKLTFPPHIIIFLSIFMMHLLLCLITVTSLLSSVVTSSHLKEHLVTGLCDSSVKSLSGI